VYAQKELSTATGRMAGNTDTTPDGAFIYKITDGGDAVNSLYVYRLKALSTSCTCGWAGAAWPGVEPLSADGLSAAVPDSITVTVARREEFPEQRDGQIL